MNREPDLSALYKQWVVIDEQDDRVVDSFEDIKDAEQCVLKFPSITYIVHRRMMEHHEYCKSWAIPEKLPDPLIVRATLTQDYFLEHERDPKRLAIVLEEWFGGKYPMGGRHAYRDGSRIGFSETVIGYRILSEDEIKEEAKLRRGGK